MSEETPRKLTFTPPSDDLSHEANRLRELDIGLSMTPAQRLRWLEETVEELRPLVGLAAAARKGPSEGT